MSSARSPIQSQKQVNVQEALKQIDKLTTGLDEARGFTGSRYLGLTNLESINLAVASV